MRTKKIAQTGLSLIIFLLISSVILFINSYPNYYALRHTPTGYVFSGQASWFDPWDINVYVSAVLSGKNNGIFLSNNYTSELSQSILLYPLYTLSGKLFSNINPFLLFHSIATLTGLLLIIGVLLFIRLLIPNKFRSYLVLTLVSLGGGFGWIVFPKIQSADLFMTGFTFTSHFQRGHESLGVLLYITSLLFIYLGITKKRFKLNLISAILLLATVFIYPYYFLSYVLISSFFIALRPDANKRYARYFISLGFNFILVLPALLFYSLHLKSSSSFSGVLSQHLSYPGVVNVALGYGILVPFLFISIVKGKKDDAFWFLTSWIGISLVLAILPLGFARFYLRTLMLPIITVIFINIDQIGQSIRIPKQVLILILIVLVPISSCFIFYKRLAEVSKINPWYYHSNSEVEALDYLNNNTIGNNSCVLSSYIIGNYIPAYTNSRVYFGHLIQTPKATDKLTNIYRFYSQDFSESEAYAFLIDNHISYIVYGKEEQNITYNRLGTTTLVYRFLNPLFQSDDITIYSIANLP